jgi:hypothetical protein
VPNQVAVRHRAGQEQAVQAALRPFGRVEVHASQRIMVLVRAAGIPKGRVDAALARLTDEKLVEFATPVLRDPASHTRQVLTDEIVVRLKPGRTRRTLAALEQAHGITIGRRNEFEPSQYVVKVPHASGTHTLDVARLLDASDDVEFASPNFLTSIER